jgi:NADP-dependent 3-hydroxy acid dehydrogenase YdfG
MSIYFISGASSGIGAEMARQLTRRGDDVAIAARRTERLQALAAELAEAPGSVALYTLDVTDPDAVDRVMRQADAELGGLDVVVVNAGRGGGGRLGSGRDEENRAVIETNLLGALAQVETAMAVFRARGRGQLVLVSSLAASRALPGSGAVYSASKVALAYLGASLRSELAGSPIGVTTLRPGYIRTDLSSRNRSPLVTNVDRGVASMLSAIDARAGDVVVPFWPWRPLGWLMKLVPASLIRRFS